MTSPPIGKCVGFRAMDRSGSSWSAAVNAVQAHVHGLATIRLNGELNPAVWQTVGELLFHGFRRRVDAKRTDL